MPVSNHWAVLVFGSIFIEGDERSRTSPGHGYPGYWNPMVEYIAFSDKEDLHVWLSDHSDNLKNYKVINVTPHVVTTEVKVKLV